MDTGDRRLRSIIRFGLLANCVLVVFVYFWRLALDNPNQRQTKTLNLLRSYVSFIYLQPQITYSAFKQNNKREDSQLQCVMKILNSLYGFRTLSACRQTTENCNIKTVAARRLLPTTTLAAAAAKLSHQFEVSPYRQKAIVSYLVRQLESIDWSQQITRSRTAMMEEMK